MNKIYITLLTIFIFNNSTYCQNATEKSISGIVLDENTQEKLKYVNIGILNKNFGTISDLKGHFRLFVTDSLVNDTLTFSYVGYKTRQIPIRKLIDSANIEINMKSRSLSINEVKIYAQKPKIKKYGVRSHTPGIVKPVYIDRDIFEVAFFVEPKKAPVKIKNLNMYVYYSEVDTCTFRINIYSCKDDIPLKRLNTKEILVKIPIRHRWNTLDLSEYNLVVLNTDFFISVEYLPTFKGEKRTHIGYGVKMVKSGRMYIRTSSQGKWTVLKFNLSFNVEVLE